MSRGVYRVIIGWDIDTYRTETADVVGNGALEAMDVVVNRFIKATGNRREVISAIEAHMLWRDRVICPDCTERVDPLKHYQERGACPLGKLPWQVDDGKTHFLDYYGPATKTLCGVLPKTTFPADTRVPEEVTCKECGRIGSEDAIRRYERGF